MNRFRQDEELQAFFTGISQDVSNSLSQCSSSEMSLPDAFYLSVPYQKQQVSFFPEARVGDGFDFARNARVDGGAKLQVFNLVWFAELRHALPILGCELLAFQKGIHLFVLDAFPLLDTEDEASSSICSCLSALRHRFASQYELSSIPEWGENVFSEHAIILKPGRLTSSEQASLLQLITEAVHSLVSVFCDELIAKKSDSADNLPAHPQSTRSKRTQYLIEHASGEPAGPFLARLGGDKWADTFIHEFLFPRWLHGEGECVPDWLPTFTQTEPIMDILRSASQAEHHIIEANPISKQIVDETLTLGSFLNLLTAYYWIHCEIENAIDATGDTRVKEIWGLCVSKTPLLLDDLLYFERDIGSFSDWELTPLEAFCDWMKAEFASSPISILGVLYVFEGSTLGGQVLRKHIGNMFSLDQRGMSYFSPYSHAGKRWKRFKGEMNQANFSEREVESIVAASRDTFSFLNEVLSSVHSGAIKQK